MDCHVKMGEGGQGNIDSRPLAPGMQVCPGPSRFPSAIDELLVPGLKYVLFPKTFAEPDEHGGVVGPGPSSPHSPQCGSCGNARCNEKIIASLGFPLELTRRLPLRSRLCLRFRSRW